MLILATALALFAAEKDTSGWFEAARNGDAAGLRKLLDAKMPVDSKTAYGATALMMAADKGHLDCVKLLIANKANVNQKDSFYQSDALMWAAYHGHVAVVEALLAAGAVGVDQAFGFAAATERTAMLQALLKSKKVKQTTLDATLAAAHPRQTELIALLVKAGAKAPASNSKVKVERKILERYVGNYQSKEGTEIRIGIRNDGLEIAVEGMPAQPLATESELRFKLGGSFGSMVEFDKAIDKPAPRFKIKSTLTERIYERATKDASLVVASKTPEDVGTPDAPVAWPGFRGKAASGIADGQHPPVHWNAATGHNIAWKARVAGLGLSCPTVVGDAIYLTTAVGDQAKSAIRKGQYGDVEPVDDKSKHKFQVLCFEAATGKLRWERTANDCVPAVKRHPKSSHATPTVAADEEVVAAFFGSEGLFVYDPAGKLLWKKDFGKLDSGWFYDPAYQWGFGSSPILHRDALIVQVDIQKNSFVAAFNKRTGEQIWRTPREEIPSWGTPTVVSMGDREVLVANATKFARGYDPATGKEIWRLGKNSEITVPTPFAHAGLVFIASGYTPIRPIYAVLPGALGDITLKTGAKKNDRIAWSETAAGPYMPTPIGYRDLLFVCANNGTVACYDAKSGKQHYRKRLPGATSGCTASPVAADGRIYFTTEDGDTLVAKAGKEFELLARNSIGETVLATPAISNGTMYIRGDKHLFALRRTTGKPPTGNAN